MTRERWQALAAVAAVALAALAHAVMSPPPSPALVNTAVLFAVAACAYTATGNLLHNRQISREEAADEQAIADRAAAINAAADMVITARPRDDFPGETCTPAAVAKYAATMGVPGVTLEEAADALRKRLQHRGFTPGPPFESHEWL